MYILNPVSLLWFKKVKDFFELWIEKQNQILKNKLGKLPCADFLKVEHLIHIDLFE